MLSITWKTDNNNKLYAQWVEADDEESVPQAKPKVRTRNTRRMMRLPR